MQPALHAVCRDLGRWSYLACLALNGVLQDDTVLTHLRTATSVVAALSYHPRVNHTCQAVLNGALCAIMLGAVASSLVDLQAIVDEYTTVVGDFIEPAFSEWLLWVSAMAAIAIFPLVIGVEWKYGDWRKEPRIVFNQSSPIRLSKSSGPSLACWRVPTTACH